MAMLRENPTNSDFWRSEAVRKKAKRRLRGVCDHVDESEQDADEPAEKKRRAV
jgi:hypothetical protein